MDRDPIAEGLQAAVFDRIGRDDRTGLRRRGSGAGHDVDGYIGDADGAFGVPDLDVQGVPATRGADGTVDLVVVPAGGVCAAVEGVSNGAHREGGAGTGAHVESEGGGDLLAVGGAHDHSLCEDGSGCEGERDTGATETICQMHREFLHRVKCCQNGDSAHDKLPALKCRMDRQTGPRYNAPSNSRKGANESNVEWAFLSGAQ